MEGHKSKIKKKKKKKKKIGVPCINRTPDFEFFLAQKGAVYTLLITVLIYSYTQAVHSMVHRWKYSLQRGNKGYLGSTSIAVGVII